MCLRPYENGLRVVITPLVLPIRIHEDPVFIIRRDEFMNVFGSLAVVMLALATMLLRGRSGRYPESL
jgi:hypothetical protein